MTAQEIQAAMKDAEEMERNLRHAIDALKKVPDHAGIDIQSLAKLRDEAGAKSRELYAELRKAQEVCSHTWVDDGRDSHYDWRKCTKCGETDRC